MSEQIPTAKTASTVSTTDCWYLTGPTAAGKTAIGIELASQINAEILSLDSMAIYRGMDIGTAKPTAIQQQRVPHHLLDIRDPTDEFSVSEYLAAAKQAIAEIHARGREVLFVGGTPMYLKVLLRGIFEGPPADWDFRRQVEQEIEQVGIAALHDRLEQVDPLSAAKLHPNDQRRIIRALEVYKTTGCRISHQQTQFEEGLAADRCKVMVVSWPRETLHQRIEQRVDDMFRDGLVDEVSELLEKFGALGRTASQAVGYCEVIEYLKPGGDLAETVSAVKARTRQFARRQETWFRSLSECQTLPMRDGEAAAEAAQRIVAAKG